MSLTRYTQNTAERAFPVTEARIMSPALPPLPRTSPNTPLVAGLSLLAGCFLGLALARERFYHSIKTGEQLENDAGLRVLGFLSIIESWRAMVRSRLAFDLRDFSLSWTRKECLVWIFDKRRRGAAEMLAGLDDSVESRSGKVIGITSPRDGDGKTTLAFNLAWSIALSAKCSMRCRQVTTQWRDQPSPLTLSRFIARRIENVRLRLVVRLI
jgi:polysaccharide biosynthesis transport protein